MEEQDEDIININSRRELFLDNFLIKKMKGTQLRLHHPTPAETVLYFNKPWEGEYSTYTTVIRDQGLYRLYYRGYPKEGPGEASHEFTCYAESLDGLSFSRPNLGLFKFHGTYDNNIILADSPPWTHNFCPFIDSKPGVNLIERFKAVGGLGKDGLKTFVSADGVHWKEMQKEPIITKGTFDSQNVAFWSQSEKCYVCYFRTFKNIDGQRYRWVSRSTSQDFFNWSEPVEMIWGKKAPEHLYTNQTQPYFRAPHIYLAIAARFMEGRQVVTDSKAKELSLMDPDWLRKDCSDAILASSRGGNIYDRTFMEAFIRPGLGFTHWVSRTNYPALGIVQSLSPNELSIYVNRNYGQQTAYLQRYKLRTDGFVSIHVPYRGGEMTTKLFRFAGNELEINYSTSAVGSIRIEIQNEESKPINNYSLNDCPEIIGDQVDYVVKWNCGSCLSSLARNPIRLRFVLKDADLYSMRFL
jgi:hypothetical protein